MDEVTLQWIVFGKLIASAIFALLYGMGGIIEKKIRRIAGSGWITLVIVVCSVSQGQFSWWYLLYWPLLYGALSIGYGSDYFREKLIKRSRYGLACAFSALPIAFVTGQWGLFVFHIILVISATTYLGTMNPVHARSEESIIGFAIVYLPPLML